MRGLRITIAVSVFLLLSFPSQSPQELQAANNKAEDASQTERWKRVGSSDGQSGDVTRVTVMGNAILIPATVEHQGVAADVLLLLDTGSSRTVVSTEIARRLNMNLTDGRRIPMQVVGGGIIEARQVRMGAVTVGPHTKKNADILVIQHTGLPVKHDGLLGMDLLRGLKYSIDFQKQIITWE